MQPNSSLPPSNLNPSLIGYSTSNPNPALFSSSKPGTGLSRPIPTSNPSPVTSPVGVPPNRGNNFLSPLDDVQVVSEGLTSRGIPTMNQGTRSSNGMAKQPPTSSSTSISPSFSVTNNPSTASNSNSYYPNRTSTASNPPSVSKAAPKIIPKTKPPEKKNKTGTWSKDEQEKFLEALEKFGEKDVKSISSYVGTRTVPQIRNHLSKYLSNKNAKSTTTHNSIPTTTRSSGAPISTYNSTTIPHPPINTMNSSSTLQQPSIHLVKTQPPTSNSSSQPGLNPQPIEATSINIFPFPSSSSAPSSSSSLSSSTFQSEQSSTSSQSFFPDSFTNLDNLPLIRFDASETPVDGSPNNTFFPYLPANDPNDFTD